MHWNTRVASVALITTVAMALSGLAGGPAEAAVRRTPIGVTSVHVASAGLNQVRVTWTGGTRTTKYAFLAGSTSMTDWNHFQTGWINADDPRIKARSITLTVPKRLRAVLGAGSGDYVFVKLVQTNSTGSPAKCRVWTPADLCRASASGSYALAGSARLTVPAYRVSIASWNVQAVTATADARAAQRWTSRKPKVIRTIEAESPDVIGTQETTTARVHPACLNHKGIDTAKPCTEQYADLGHGLKGFGTAAPDAWKYVYRQYAAHSADSRYAGYVDSAIYYKRSTISEVRHGFVSPYSDLHVSAMRSDDEAGVWALLRDRASGRKFLMVSMHLPVGPSHEQLRRTETAALARWAKAESAKQGGVPLVLAADLNSYAGEDAHPAVVPLRDAGFTDAAATSHRTNARWSTTNESNSTTEVTGYPSVAVEHPYPTNRIDYVLTYVPGASAAVAMASAYHNVVHLMTSHFLFDPRFEGSDHNMQLADIGLPMR